MRKPFLLMGEIKSEENGFTFSNEITSLERNLEDEFDVFVVDPFGSEPRFYSGKQQSLVESLPRGATNLFVASSVDNPTRSVILDAENMFANLSLMETESGEPVSPVNSQGIIHKFLAKNYLVELTNSRDLPVIPTERVDSFERLKDLASSSERYFAKPLAGECSRDAVVLNGMTEEGLWSYWSRLNTQTGPLEAGIVVQPYVNGFVKGGERKIGVVNGEITLSRVHRADDGQEIVAWTRGAKILRYEPTPTERDLVLKAWDWAANEHGARYARVDLAPNGKPLISEIEVVNPHFCVEMDEMYTNADIQRHMKALRSIME